MIIQTVEPGIVMTDLYISEYKNGTAPKFLETAKNYTSVAAEDFASSAVNTIGWTGISNGCLKHYFVSVLAKIGSQKTIDKKLLDVINN